MGLCSCRLFSFREEMGKEDSGNVFLQMVGLGRFYDAAYDLAALLRRDVFSLRLLAMTLFSGNHLVLKEGECTGSGRGAVT